MQIRARTSLGREVMIIAFVSRYNDTYAVTIDNNGRLWDYCIKELTVLDRYF